MFDTKLSRKVAFYGGGIAYAALCLVFPFFTVPAILGLTLYGAAAITEDVIHPWIDAGDDDDEAAGF